MTKTKEKRKKVTRNYKKARTRIHLLRIPIGIQRTVSADSRALPRNLLDSFNRQQVKKFRTPNKPPEQQYEHPGLQNNFNAFLYLFS
jgi:hypothetical protein